VNISGNVTIIENYAFSGCGALTSVFIGNSVKTIGDNGFSFCGDLEYVTMGSGTTTIGYRAFANSDLTSISFLGLDAPTSVGENWIYETYSGLLGHAYAASNFPAPGSDFYGLTMGDAIIPAGGPSTPYNLTANAGNAQVALAWWAAGDNGSAIIHYNVYRSASEDGTYSLIASPTDLYYTDTGLINGRTYWYKVSAVNTAGEGGMTVPVFSTPFTVPDAPTNLSVTPSNAHVTISWTPPADNGYPNVTNYTIYRSTNETGNYSLIASISGLNYVDDNLTNGQTYWYMVSAANVAGEGAQSPSLSVLVPNSTSPGSDNTLLILAATIVALVILLFAAVFVMRKRRS
jgi:hypothetical protein